MPNWVYNRVSFDCDDVKRKAIMKFLKSGKSKFDFNNVIPMPKALQECNASCGELSEQQKANKAVYGYYDWYDWSIDKWGCKWNASEVELQDDGQVTFSTPWSAPWPVLSALSKLFPDVEIYVDTVEEMGSFDVITSIKNGEFVSFKDADKHKEYDDKQLKKLTKELLK